MSKFYSLIISVCSLDKFFCMLCGVAILCFFHYDTRFDYEHLRKEELDAFLLKAVNPNLIIDPAKPTCHYDYLNVTTTLDLVSNFPPNGVKNGGYSPEDCNPEFSVAILVTFRNRQSQLDLFLPYMHIFLRKQKIHYKIYVIEQQDETPFNKGLLYNIGAEIAIRDKFPCLILHDVDLFPLDDANLYACLRQPRHMSASLDKFRFILPHLKLSGGVLAIAVDQYVQVNGFSNEFLGWGGEDDNFSDRMAMQNLEILRLSHAVSRYSMLVHSQENKNPERRRIMRENLPRAHREGYNSALYRNLSVRRHQLFTLVGVRLYGPVVTTDV